MSLARLAGAWCVAIAVAAMGFGLLWPLVAAAGVAIASGLALGGRWEEGGRLALFALVAALAMFHYQASRPDAMSGIDAFNDGAEVQVRGVVDGEPVLRETTQQLRVRVDAYRAEDAKWVSTDGLVLVTARPFPVYAYGDLVELTAELTPPQRIDGFDYRAYLAQQGIGSVSLFPGIVRTGRGGGSDLKRALIDLRGRLSRGIEVSMPEPEASLATGILLGNRSSIPDDVTDDFNRSGISHLIAISGANMLLVAGATIGLLWPMMGRRAAIVVAMVVVALYAALVGGSPSVLRGAAMAVVVLGAQLAGRQSSGISCLALTIAALTIVAPGLAGSTSFQLSVASTTGIVLFATPLSEALRNSCSLLRSGPGGWFTEQTAITLSATVGVQPVIVQAFGRMSLVALPANLLAAPAFVAVIPLSLITSVAGCLDAGFGRLLGDATGLPLTYLAKLAQLASDAPAASVHVNLAVVLLLTAALLVCGRAFVRRYATREAPIEDESGRLRISPALAAAATLSLLAGFLFIQQLTPGSPRLQVTVLDVGQGDAILIEAPDGRVVLVDGGPSVSRLLNELGAALPAGEHRIDLVVLTHPQEDHVAGLAGLFDRYEVDEVLAGAKEGVIPSYQAWREAIAANSVPTIEAEAGLQTSLGGGVRLQVLNPPQEGVHGGTDELNENSVVLRLVYGNVSFLLTGDLGFAGEDVLLDSGFDLRANVLKVGHHGSDSATSAAFLDAVAPDLAVISTGAGNSFGHPSPSTRLRLAGIPTLRTDLNGRVTFETDGRSLWVASEAGSAEVVSPGLAEK